ncbi:hypothetical protein D3C75_660230 [compost metagenome]
MHGHAVEISRFEDALTNPQMAIGEQNHPKSPDPSAVLLNQNSELIGRTGFFQALKKLSTRCDLKESLNTIYSTIYVSTIDSRQIIILPVITDRQIEIAGFTGVPFQHIQCVSINSIAALTFSENRTVIHIRCIAVLCCKR